MFYFVCILRLLATALITNSHYSEVWPISALSFGGLLGNVIFFAVSGFCLYNVKDGFFRWYGKRFLKIYPVVAAFTLFTVLIGSYKLSSFSDFIRLFVFPTNYVFIVWIIVLYVPFYFIAKLDHKNSDTLKLTALCCAAICVAVYVFFVDKSRYSVDDVNSPFILFVYFISMLMGAWFNKKRDKFDKFRPIHALCACFSLVLYFATKVLLVKFSVLYPVQIFNQATLLLALAFVFVLAMELEDVFKRLDRRVFAFVSAVSGMTLHIYIVQFVIIRRFSGIIFPLNLVVVTALILACAAALYYLEYYIRKGAMALCTKGKKASESNAEN